MKIDKRIRDVYNDQLALNAELKNEVDKLFGTRDPHWHYESRLKSAENFALKIEAGIFQGDLVIDDFLGCLLVVRNSTETRNAFEFVTKHFNYKSRRPKDDIKTTKSPTDFTFDDLRIYVQNKPVEYLSEHPRNNIVFEVQIKTFLQHAWGIATHDLTYKTDAVSWAKTRIAHQIRAMLEHAELSIEQVQELADSALVAKVNPEFEDLAKIIEALKANWTPERLPKDLLRLAKNTRAAINVFGISLSDLNRGLAAETAEGRGVNLENLSPYGTIMQTILLKFPDKVAAASKQKRKIPISSEVELPSTMDGLNPGVFRLI